MSATQEDIARLYEEFPRKAISWRAQSLTKDGSKAMALAYIDARDVMDRLDTVVGPANWQRNYTHAEKKTICSIGIKIDGEWVWKSDGAGDSDIEAEKGAISDAFKRAAVNWGIARYLYNMPSPWVPCEVSVYNGKTTWKSWKEDPWKFVRGAPQPVIPEVDDKKQPDPAVNAGSRQQSAANDAEKPISAAEQKRQLIEIDNDLSQCMSVVAVKACADGWQHIANRDGWSRDYKLAAADKFKARREQILAQEDTVANIQDQFQGARVVNETVRVLREEASLVDTY